MNKHNIKRILICLVLLACIIGAASASDVSDIELDDSTIDAVAVDAISEDSGDTVYNTVSEVQANASQELNDDNVVEQTKNSLSSSNIKDGEVSNTLYVSTTGSDDNDGSASAPVATIAKALEIATNSSGTDFTISVAAGEYASETIDSPEGKNINLLGADRDTTILHLSGTYGINVYQDDVNWTIENLTLCDLVSTATRSTAVQFVADRGSLYVNNVVITNISSKYGAFSAQSEEGKLYVSNTTIKDIHANAASASVIYVAQATTDITFDNLEITGFDLSESYASSTAYARTIIYGYAPGSTINIINSRIVNNSAPMYALIESKTTTNIINTTIADNYVQTSETGAAGQYFLWTGTSSSTQSKFNISQSAIVNNKLDKSGYGLFTSTYGNHNIEYSVIMDNIFENGDAVPYIRTSGGTVTADYNYWGTNNGPSGASVNNWVILTAETPEFAFVNVPDAITFYLNSYNTTSGTVGVLDKTLGGVTLDVSYALNTANPSTVTIKDSIGTVDYLATQDGTETVTLSTGDAFSFEINADASSLIYVDGSVETSGTGTSESPFKTIAEALNIAADGKIIMIRSGTYNEKDLVIDDDITVKAERGANVYIDAESQGRIFTVTSTATLKDLVLSNGTTDANGGAIYLNGGSLTLNNVYIYDSKALNGGAVADTADSNLIVIDSNFVGNNATNGGAIYVAGTANITDSAFLSNDPDNGGAIYVTGTANIESNQFNSNVANNGGAIYIDSANPQTIKDNTFASNVADHNEAVYIKNSAVDWSGNTLGENEVIYLESGSIKSKLTFLGGNTITADFSQTLDLTATLTDDQGNTIRGGSVTFTANGETIGTVDLSGDNELKTSYTTPASADSDVTISGSYSLDNAGTVVNGTVHLAIPKWFIEGGNGYETLAEAVAAADKGDVIYGVPGTYTVNGITINKDITIKANEIGTIILDGDATRMFTLDTYVNATLLNLDLTNGGKSGGGFVSVSSSGTINIINSTVRDLSASSAGGAIYVTPGGKVNIEGSRFENINSTNGAAVLQATGPASVISIKDSSFDRIKQTSNDYTIMQISGTLIAERSNFTNIDGCNRSNYYCGIATYSSNANFTITECQFINMTGGDGSAIYFGSTGKLNVTKSVFMNIDSQRGAIFVNNPDSANINYNLFIDNTAVGTNAKDVYINSGSNINASYNFWGSNSQPTTKEISNVARAPYWTIVELSTAADPVYVGTTPDIAVQFVGTNGTENLTLEDTMPEYSFDLAVTAGSLSAEGVTLVDNEASVVFTPPASEGTVTVTATPGPAELVLNVVDPAVLLVVSTDGDDDTGAGTLDNPYATIEHALTQVTDTRNIIYILSKGEDYLESDLTVSGNVIIRGEDSTVTIDADSEGRVFIVTGTLTLEDISLTGGMTNDIGGAIFVNGGNLTVNNVYIDSCGAGSGGAIGTTAGSNLTVSDSTFDGNIGSYGGAIYVGGEASISDSEFVDHEYAIYGGAIYVNTTDDVAITGNSFDGNDADKGEAIYIENGAVSLSENTMVDIETIFIKGGSVNGILIFLANTTVNADFGETVDLTATLTDDRGNPIVGGNVVFTANGETVATVENSGSSLQTTYTVPTDASGDILISGSFSLGDGMVVATGVLHPAISYWFIEGGSGYETLAQAIDAAQTGDVIYGLPGTYDISGLTVNKAVTIKANESGSIILNGKGNQILRTSANVILENLTFINGSATDNGGLIYISSNSLVINNSVLKDTQATGGQGAAIYVASGASNVVIENSAFDNINTTAAAVINCKSTSSVFTVVKSNFTNMDITTNGVFYFYEGGINAIESQFINITGGDGAAIYFYGLNNNNVTKCLFDNVTTTKTSGIIYSNSKSANVSYNVFLGINKGMYSSSSYSGVITADYNYWGTNDNPSDYVNSNTKLNNWVIMTVTPDAVDSIAPGATQAFTVDFTHYTDGTANYTMADTIPELTVSASAANGQLDVEEKETVNNQAVFTYTMGDYVSDTITFTNANVSIPVAISGVEPYTGIIYVAKDGEDTNDGSEDSPVASIAKAVELAQGKSGQIIIKEGTYVAQGVNITDDLDISTQGDVIWDAQGSRAFIMSAGDVSISNITFTNGNQSSTGTLLRVTGGDLTFDGCKFVDNGADVRSANGVLNIVGASLNLTNCVFENNTQTPTGTSYGIIYVSGSTLYVDNCNFTNNRNKYGVFYITTARINNVYVPSIAVINNSAFIGNNATSSSGGQGAAIYVGGIGGSANYDGAHTYAYVENCDFINNTAGYGSSTYGAATSGKGGAIYVNNNATFIAVNSRFINNSALADALKPDGTVGGGAIYASSGEVLVSNSVFKNNQAGNGSAIYMYYYGADNTTLNKLYISNSVIIGDNSAKLIQSDYTNGSLIANNNWWHANENPSDRVSEGITVDSWVILTADPSEVTANVGEPVAITANFRHTNNTEGVVADLEGEFPELEVYGYALDGGEITEFNMTVENVATLYYTPEEAGETTVYAVEGNAMVPIKVIVSDAPQPITDVIYVSPSGNDENPGTYESPVATIAKAVELASAENAQGIVIVEAGLYNENGIVINSPHAISITGNGTVIIRGNNHVVNGNGAGLVLGEVIEESSIMIVNTTEAVEIKNIQFEDNNATNGGAILINADNSRNLKTVDVTIENCTFTHLEGRNGGAILGTYINGTVLIKDSNFTQNTARAWGGAVAMTYSAYDNDCLKLEIVGCDFENNTANNAGALYLMAQDISIKDSSILNNNATYHPGALYLQNCTAVINNTVIANNSARYDKAAIAIHGATIDYQTREVNPSNIVIINSIIENNIGRERAAPAIYLENSRLNMSYSSVVNEMNINNTITATYGDEQPGNIIINNNWWGTNDPSTTIFGTNITMDNWVIMNAVPNATEAITGGEVKVTIDFNHVNTTAGEIEELTGGVIPRDSYTVALTVDNGTIAPETLTIANGESGEAVFTAANANALITLTSENAVENILILVGDQPVPYTGIVYVSKDGDDANEGTEDEPVATIAKAIEIATAEGGSGQIVIKEGTYTENGFNITKDLTITGEGDVIIDALGDGTKLFNIGYGSGVANFELHNLALTNLDSRYGAAVYSYANNMVLDNITIAGIDSQNSRLITSNGALTVKDSVFANNTVSTVITQGGNANVTIINTTFENNNASDYDTSEFAIVYVSSGRGNITIEDSKFYGNLARQSTIRGTTDTNIVVKGSEFINNTANNGMYSSSGGVIYAQAKLDVTESIFINNAAKNSGGAIFVGRNGEATITKSEFINNSVSASESSSNGASIYNNGKTTINYSIILSNSTKYAVYNDGEETATVNAQYNWWGTNDNPQSLAGAGTWEDYLEEETGDCQAVDVSNWIVMSVTAEGIDAASEGSEVTLTVDFNHYIDANGEVKELEDSLAQELDVEFSSSTGTFDNEVVTTTDSVATAKYTVASGENDITVKSTNAVWNTEFATKAVPDISFEIVEDTIEVSLSYEGEGLEGKTVKVSLENGTEFVATTDEDGIAVIDLSSLGPGTYEFTLSSVADEDYGAAVYEETITYTVDPYLTELTVDDVTVIVGEGNLTATLTSNGVGIAGKTLVLDINTQLPGKALGAIATMTAVTDEDGVAVFDLSGLEAGIYEATVSYTDGVVYESVDADVTIEVDKKMADTTVEIDEDNNVIVTVKDGEDGLEGIEVELTINNQTLKGTTDADGKAVIALGEMEDGSYPATISFTNDTYADPNLKTFVILKTKEVEVPVEVPVVANGTMDVETEDGAVVATLTDSEGNPIANATLTAVVDGEEQNFTTDENGKVSVPIVDNATVELSYTDPENGATVKYATKVVTNVVEVPVEVPEPKANATVELATEDGSAVTVTVKDLDGNPIANATAVATINGEETNITTDSEGKATIPLSGNSTVKVSFTDPANNATTSNEMSVTVIENVVEKIIEVIPNRTETVIEYKDMNTTSVVVGVDGRIGKFFNATLKDINGNPLVNKTVQIGFNGKTYNRTTDENGHVELQINLKAAGRYTFALAYLGDEYYNGTFEVALITVEKQKAKLTTASKTYKASAKTKSISATFKSASGNAIPGIKVSFTVNGKTYTAKTNSKGVATVKVSLNKKGTYSFTAKTTATDAYASVSAKAKLTIK